MMLQVLANAVFHFGSTFGSDCTRCISETPAKLYVHL